MACRFTSLALLVGLILSSVQAVIAETPTFENFASLHRMIRPAAEESRWLEIDWQTDFWKARQLAAAQGKPILLWSGGGALPLGGC